MNNKADTGVFTLCSFNYLACAKILGDSLLKFNPHLRLIIGLVDKIEGGIDLSSFSSFEIIEIGKIDIPNFNEMITNYDIVELNTAIKPSFFKYLFKTHDNFKNILYLDPDIMIFDELTFINQALNEFDILLTPQINRPMKDSGIERFYLRSGLYNLGFIGLKRSKAAFDFLDWWQERLRKYCKLSDGLYVDQKWVDFAPIFFDNVGILKHPGLNVACWNMHERSIMKKDNKFFVNNEYPLIFFHFSGVIINPNNYTLQWPEDKLPLIDDYKNLLIANKHDYWQQLKCYYVELNKSAKKKNIWSRPDLNLAEKIPLQFYLFLKSLLPRVIKKAIAKIRSV
ncbi:MAG: glycosyl transferase [Candidatus Omnitrophica bacterium]|nr:glycosyl transferase [Candidatus Omnitrophota bacterium]